MDRSRLALVVILAVTVVILSLGVLSRSSQRGGGWFGYSPGARSDECSRLVTDGDKSYDVKVKRPPGLRR